MMHGHGYYKQSNCGYQFEGQFENNLPTKMPSKLVILTSDELTAAAAGAASSKPLKFEIYEGQNFRIWVRAINDEGEIFNGLF